MRKQPSVASGGLGDRTPFYGFQTPQEIKSFFTIKKALDLDKTAWKNILTFVNSYLQNLDFKNDQFNELVDAIPLNEEESKGVISAIIVIARCVLKNPIIRQEHFEEDLKILKIPDPCIGILNKMLFGPNRAVIDSSIVAARVSLPRFVAFKWRVDVTISNTFLQRALTPTVLGELLLSNGSSALFEMSIEKFHELRFNVAIVLRDMEEIRSQHSTLKIA